MNSLKGINTSAEPQDDKVKRIPTVLTSPQFLELVTKMAGKMAPTLFLNLAGGDFGKSLEPLKELASVPGQLLSSQVILQHAFEIAQKLIDENAESILDRVFKRHDEMSDAVEKNAADFYAHKLSMNELQLLASKRGLYRDIQDSFAKLRRDHAGHVTSLGFVHHEDIPPPEGSRPIGFIWSSPSETDPE